jgi:hypothetical protein
MILTRLCSSHLAEIIEVAEASRRGSRLRSRYNRGLEAILDDLSQPLASLSPLTKPTGVNLRLYEIIFGSIISQELQRQEREKQTVVQLLSNRGELKTRMAQKEMEYNTIMNKSAAQKAAKAKKHVSDASW